MVAFLKYISKNAMWDMGVGRALPKCLDAIVHSQSSPRSIFCRLLRMLRRFFGTCELPPDNTPSTDRLAQTILDPQVDTDVEETQVAKHSSHAHSPQQARTVLGMKEYYNEIQADTTFDHLQQRPNLTHQPVGI